MLPPEEWHKRFFARKRADSSVSFTPSGIEFRNYDFSPASVFPGGLLPYSQIESIGHWTAPPEIHTRSGEILFVAAVLEKELQRAAHVNSIPIVRRLDVWALILEPFLDTEFSEEHQRQTLDQLNRAGLTDKQVEEIRRRVGAPVGVLNYMFLWNWCYLGLYDVLDIMQAALEPVEYRDFYAEAMRIARIAGSHAPS